VLAEHAPDTLRWRALMRRGDYLCLARFAKDSMHFLPPIVSDSFTNVALEEAAVLADASRWISLAKGLALCEWIGTASMRELLESAALARIERTDPATERFGDFTEIASGLILIWRHREASRTVIGSSLWEILPSRTEWPDDHELLIGAGLLLEIGRDPLVGRESAGRLIQAFTTGLPARAIRKSDAHILYLFVWNMGACRALWHGPRPVSLSNILDHATQERILNRLGSLIPYARTNCR
jgi:hypothetical protein